jgi:hypothetical protein
VRPGEVIDPEEAHWGKPLAGHRGLSLEKTGLPWFASTAR